MFDRKRRVFITLLGGAAGWPLAARAQHSSIPVLGILGSASAATYTRTLATLRKGLNEAGYKAVICLSNPAGRSSTTIDCRRSRPSW
jgi:hypothetical protein